MRGLIIFLSNVYVLLENLLLYRWGQVKKCLASLLITMRFCISKGTLFMEKEKNFCHQTINFFSKTCFYISREMIVNILWIFEKAPCQNTILVAIKWRNICEAPHQNPLGVAFVLIEGNTIYPQRTYCDMADIMRSFFKGVKRWTLYMIKFFSKGVGSLHLCVVNFFLNVQLGCIFIR